MRFPKYLLVFCLMITSGLVTWFVLASKSTDSVESINSSTQTTSPTPVTTNSASTTPKTPSTTNTQGGSAELLDHDTYISFSSDPTSFPKGVLVTESASVPDVLICEVDSAACAKGEFLIYFVDPLNETDSMEGVAVIRSTDGGDSWSDREPISIAGKVNKGPAVDPSVVQLPDGTLRMYYYGPDKPFGGGPVTQGELHAVYSATSTDGITFTADAGTRLSVENLTDPEVIYWNAQWLMYYSEGQTAGVASSTDGLVFKDRGTISLATGGVPGALAMEEGVRVYGCAIGGITSSFSSDGITFTDLIASILPPTNGGRCDPSVVAYEDGYVLVYKIAPPKTTTPVTQ